MAEDKTPDPMWTTGKVHAVIAKIYSEYEPYCERDLDRMLARDVATVIAQIFQLGEAYEVSVARTRQRLTSQGKSLRNIAFRPAASVVVWRKLKSGGTTLLRLGRRCRRQAGERSVKTTY